MLRQGFEGRSTRGSGGFACTFFGLARGIGPARFHLFFPSFVQSVSSSSHKNILFTTFAKSVPLGQVAGHLKHFPYYQVCPLSK